MSTKAFIFDFDGTLADSMLMVLPVYNSVAKGLGLPAIEESEIPKLRKMGPMKAIDAYQVPLWKVPLVLSRVRREIETRGLVPAIFPGLLQVFRDAAMAQVRRMIMSSNSRTNIERFTQEHLLGHFERIDSGASLFGKATRLRRILQVSRLAPTEVVYVGDELRDVEAAREVGVKSIAVSWGYADRSELAEQRPTHLVDAPGELLEVLRSLL